MGSFMTKLFLSSLLYAVYRSIIQAKLIKE